MEITIRSFASIDQVDLKGRIDSYTAPELAEQLNSITSQNRYRIILDMSNVVFVSSAGLLVFINFQKICKKKNQGEIILVNTPIRVYETFELAGFASLFKFAKDVSSAIAAFKTR